MNNILKISLAVSCVLLSATSLINGQSKSVSPFQTRCGWYSNPTPSNHSLYDKDGDWLIGAQGGHQAEGDSMPTFKSRQWIITNSGGYGYGCACFRLRVDYETGYVLEIKSAYAKPLSACRQDRTLGKWNSLFK
jgi:hypothetical protein